MERRRQLTARTGLRRASDALKTYTETLASAHGNLKKRDHHIEAAVERDDRAVRSAVTAGFVPDWSKLKRSTTPKREGSLLSRMASGGAESAPAAPAKPFVAPPLMKYDFRTYKGGST